jgi:hypothetical protein
VVTLPSYAHLPSGLVTSAGAGPSNLCKYRPPELVRGAIGLPDEKLYSLEVVSQFANDRMQQCEFSAGPFTAGGQWALFTVEAGGWNVYLGMKVALLENSRFVHPRGLGRYGILGTGASTPGGPGDPNLFFVKRSVVVAMTLPEDLWGPDQTLARCSLCLRPPPLSSPAGCT